LPCRRESHHPPMPPVRKNFRAPVQPGFHDGAKLAGGGARSSISWAEPSSNHSQVGGGFWVWCFYAALGWGGGLGMEGGRVWEFWSPRPPPNSPEHKEKRTKKTVPPPPPPPPPPNPLTSPPPHPHITKEKQTIHPPPPPPPPPQANPTSHHSAHASGYSHLRGALGTGSTTSLVPAPEYACSQGHFA